MKVTAGMMILIAGIIGVIFFWSYVDCNSKNI